MQLTLLLETSVTSTDPAQAEREQGPWKSLGRAQSGVMQRPRPQPSNSKLGSHTYQVQWHLEQQILRSELGFYRDC